MTDPISQNASKPFSTDSEVYSYTLIYTLLACCSRSVRVDTPRYRSAQLSRSLSQSGDRDRRDEMVRGRREDDRGRGYHEDRDRRRSDARDRMPDRGQRGDRDRGGDGNWVWVRPLHHPDPRERVRRALSLPWPRA